MLRSLLDALPRAGVREIIYLSSTDVYGLPPAELPIREATNPRPTSEYGWSKLAAESLLFAATGKVETATVLRLPGVYGPGDEGQSAIGRIVARLRKAEPVDVTGTGSTLRDFLHVRDVAGAIASLLKEPYGGILNVATGESRSIRDVVELAAGVLGVEAEIRPQPADPARDHDLKFDVSRLRSHLGEWKPLDVASGLRDYIAETAR
jgi:UDP-glucose 4-epimerase